MADPYAAEYLDTPDAVELFLTDISGVRELALDTEGASFHKFVDRVYLLQLATRDRNAILDPLRIGSPRRLGVLLENPEVEVVLHDADYDLRLLHQDYGWHVNHIFDTRIAAQLVGIKSFGLGALLEQFFGVKLDKKHQRADWSQRPLGAEMLDYAAQDTRYLLDLRDTLHSRLEQLGRLEWAREEFQRLEGTRWEDEEPDSAFMRVKGARDLSRRELAILRELVRWRDAVAREQDRATFRVIGNDLLLVLAQSAPRSMGVLRGNRSIPRVLVLRYGAQIIGAVERGLAVREDELPKFPKSPRWERDPDFDSNVARLKGVRDEAATRLHLDPGVLCSRDRLEAIARRKPRTLADLHDIRELRRWQIAQLGEGFLHVLTSP